MDLLLFMGRVYNNPCSAVECDDFLRVSSKSDIKRDIY